MRPNIEQLHDHNLYNLTESFHIDDMMQFVNRELGMGNKDQAKNKFSLKSILFLIFSMVIGFLVAQYAIKFSGSATQIGIGFACLLIIVLPIHELIHGLTFKSFGAKQVGYGFSMKAMMIYAYAQEFPVSMPELRKVAMMPFLVITPILIILMILLPKFISAFATILLIHTLSCIGDYALVRYANRNMNKDVYTYDDITGKKMSYFFEKK